MGKAVGKQSRSAREDSVVFGVFSQGIDELIELILEFLRLQLSLMGIPGAEKLCAGAAQVGPKVTDAAAVFEQLRLRVAESALIRGSRADHDS